MAMAMAISESRPVELKAAATRPGVQSERERAVHREETGTKEERHRHGHLTTTNGRSTMRSLQSEHHPPG